MENFKKFNRCSQCLNGLFRRDASHFFNKIQLVIRIITNLPDLFVSSSDQCLRCIFCRVNSNRKRNSRKKKKVERLRSCKSFRDPFVSKRNFADILLTAVVRRQVKYLVKQLDLKNTVTRAAFKVNDSYLSVEA